MEPDQESTYSNMEYETEEDQESRDNSQTGDIADQEYHQEEDQDDPDQPGPSRIQHTSKYKTSPDFDQKKSVFVGKKEAVEPKFAKPDSLSEILDDELLKARMGLGTDAILKDLLTKLETERVNKEPTSGKQFKEDGLTLKKFSQLAIYKIAGLSDENSKIVDPSMMAQKLRDCFANDADGEALPAFTLIGKNLSHLLRKAPDHAYVRPCLAFNQTQNVRVKKERIKKEKAATQTQVIRGKTTKQVHEASKDENSITKELDNVRRQLKAAWKQAASNQIGYYPFVLHPQALVNRETNMPTIVKLSSAERAQRDNVDRSTWDTTQVLAKITHSIWQGLVKRLGVAKPMIVR
uniref:Uncharacterized protein n=1 Tax=Ditylenchus dipsaci TaxID=166011 RepID=A0A915DWK5_9BILA